MRVRSEQLFELLSARQKEQLALVRGLLMSQIVTSGVGITHGNDGRLGSTNPAGSVTEAEPAA